MTELRIGGSVASDLSSGMVDYSVDTATTEGAGDGKEITWQNPYWNIDYGYYQNIPENKTLTL